MRWLVGSALLLLVGCSSAGAVTPSLSPVSPAAPAVMTAAEYWDEQGPAEVRELCVPIQFFDENVADLKYDHDAYETVYESFVSDDYVPGPTSPSSEDAFAELLSRCDV